MALVLKPLLVWVLAILVLAACTPLSTGSRPSPSPSGSPAPTARPADSKAADLRTQLDLLLGEHTMLVAKQAVAASNHTDEYAGYLTLLATNANSLVDVVRAGYGNTAANQFAQAWGIQNGYLVDYTIGVVTHNDAKSNGAMSGLVNGFAPQFAQLLASVAQLPVDSVTQLELAQLDAFKSVVDDETAQSYTKLYTDIRFAHGHSSRIGDMLAVRMAQQFPDKFPGDPTINAVEARITLNDLLQEDSYLTTMVSDAGIAGRGAEAAAALGGVAGVRTDLAPVIGFLLGPDGRAGFPGIWGIRDADLFAYSNSSDAGARQRLTGSFVSQFSALTHAPAPAVRDQLVATLKVMDDQRAKASKNIAGDDRSAASAMQSIADQI
ncbi:MAG TPA: hypothetical protein VKF16_11900 [Candidatus Dormibacteraeota bacterium]|nr:hypothetical protein [Candidatus Dormibacteraeota bacterium]